MQKERKVAHFEQSVLPHLGAAYNLARWLLRNPADAEDVVQESYLRAFRFFGGYHGGDGRAWLLKIVRNTAYTWLQHNRSRELAEPFNDEIEGDDCSPRNLLSCLNINRDRGRNTTRGSPCLRIIQRRRR